MQLFGRLADARRVLRELCGHDVVPIELDAFSDGGEVRRGVETRAQVRGAADGVEQRSGRAFAVRASELHRGISALRII